jgi:hypothetical protein
MGNEGDRLIVGRYNPAPPTYTPLLTLTADSAWTHHWVLLDESESYSGPLGIYLQAEQAGSSPMQVHLDEVNVGKSPGGPNRVYLPIISK